MKSFLIKCIVVICSVFFFMEGVNFFSKKPTSEYEKEYCTKYCHDKGCRHFLERDTPLKNLSGIYKDNILWLRNNPIPKAYAANNLIIYVVFYPLLFSGLLFTILKLRNEK